MNFIKTETKGNYCIIRLDRGRGNPMNQVLIGEFVKTLHNLKDDESINGVIIAGNDKFFSAGVDVLELYDFDAERVRLFWMDFVGLIKELVMFPKPLIAAITGHAPAGGCVVAICCDYRVMAKGNGQIGLNELMVGITLPEIIFQLYAFWIGRHRAYQNLMEAKMMTAEEALSIGLVDEVCASADVVSSAEMKLNQYLSFGPISWQHSKQNTRKELIEMLTTSDFDKAFKKTLDKWWTPEARQRLEMLVSVLRK